MRFSKRYSCLLCLALLSLVISACSTVPLTGRRQLILVSEGELTAMSLESYKQVLSESTLSKDPAQVDMVRRIGGRLAAATEKYLGDNGLPTEHYQWEFSVIQDDETVNAWCMPGGKIAVYTGLFPVSKDEGGLAVVMSHEIAHAVARHGNERMSQQLLVKFGASALSTAMKNSPEQTRDIFLGVYGAGAQAGVLLPYSRNHESEADRIGLTLMAMAGYDPRAAVPLWERMDESGGARPPEILSTHPAPSSRIENIKAYLPEALVHYRAR